MVDNSKIIEIHQELELIDQSSSNLKDNFYTISRIFYKFVKIFTEDEGIVFKNFYAKFRYFITIINLSEQERNNFDAFRKFIRRGFSEKINQESIEQGILLIKKLCARTIKEPSLLSTLINDKKYNNRYFVGLGNQKIYSQLKDLKLLYVDNIIDQSNHFITLHCFDLDNLESKIYINIYKSDASHLFYLRNLLSENSLIYCHNLVYVSENRYKAKSDSLVVIEPDFLVDASAISECFSNKNTSSDIFFLTRLVTELAGAPALKGSIVGHYLDELVRNRQINGEQIFKDYKKSDALKSAYLGEDEMNNIKKSIYDEHLENINKLVHRLRQEKLNLWIEPTFFSKTYGLQGRLDLLTISQTGSKDIIELKSGSPPYPGREWKNHKMQVVAYNMMLESTYDDYQGINEIFYSKSDQPRRNIVSEYQEKHHLLKVRNEIVTKIYRLAQGDFHSLDNLKINGIEELSQYNLRRLQRFQQNYLLGRLTTNYYQQLLAFTLRELINSKTSDQYQSEAEDQHHSSCGFSSLWLDDFEIKEKKYRLIYDLKLISLNKEKSYVTLKFIRQDIAHAFRSGDMVIIYPKINNVYAPLKQHIFKGSIKEINQENILISLFNKQTDYSFIEQYDIWALETDIFERNYWSSIGCLLELLSCSMEKKQLLLGHLEPKFESINYQQNSHLTDRQNQITEQALGSKHYYLLQGPPGTGKTSIFLVNYVQGLIKSEKKNIFILAFTNKAVEQICKAFNNPRQGSQIDYMRLGNKNIVDENLATEKLKGDNADGWRNTLENNRVFVTTVSTFKDKYLLLKEFVGTFDQLVIDEASQLTEADIAGILALFNKFVLIGDQKQLPAVITQNEEECVVKVDEFKKYSIDIVDLRMSLFERLILNAKAKGWSHCFGQLTEHYRMHKDIAQLISVHYDQELRHQQPRQADIVNLYKLKNDYFPNWLNSSRTIFVETPSELNIQQKNTNEAIIIAFIAKLFIKNKILKPKEIGIIAPFRAQVAEIKKQIDYYFPGDSNQNQDLVVDTVERYQGDERELIIFSTTITWSRQIKNIQSIAYYDEKQTDRKLLVSISRARNFLIILGNSSQLKQAPAYRYLIDKIKTAGGLIPVEVSEKILTDYYEKTLVF